MDMMSYGSILKILQLNAKRHAHKAAVTFKRRGEWVTLSYAQFYDRILMASRGLRKAGIKPGDRVAIFSENRTGWAIADFGVQAARAITVPIYATNTAEQAEYVINHSESRIVFVSTRLQYEKILQIRQNIPHVERVVSFEQFLGSDDLPVNTLQQLSEVSHPLTDEERVELEEEIAQITPEDLITVIYTSGTTGVPKGVMLTHSNMLFDACAGVQKLGGMAEDEVFLSFLPLSHVLERTAGYHAPLMYGAHVAFAENVDKVVENILEIRPTVMVSVPRLFEKIYSRIYENVHQAPAVRRSLFHWAVDVGKQYVYRRYIEKQPVGSLGVKYGLAKRLVFSKIKPRFGGRMRFFISGGAPLDKTINEFMWAVGIPVFEGYGLTETSPALTLNTIADNRFGSVGQVLDQTEVKTAEDGELLVRGPQVMQGYYKNPEATAQTIIDGWLYTGDIARIDENGFVYIVDRKKEIIVTAGGKNVAPQPIEDELKLDKYISQAFVYGDRKPYLVALLTPNVERLLEFAQDKKLNYIEIRDLVTHKKVHKLFEERVRDVNAKLPSYETIKKFVILPRDFSIEDGELTPTLKLKRKVIAEKYRVSIEGMFDANGNGNGNAQK